MLGVISIILTVIAIPVIIVIAFGSYISQEDQRTKNQVEANETILKDQLIECEKEESERYEAYREIFISQEQERLRKGEITQEEYDFEMKYDCKFIIKG